MSDFPVAWIFIAAVIAPLLTRIPLGVKIPVVVLEVLLGIVIGPHVLGLVSFDGYIPDLFRAGMGATLFMAGMELDFGKIKGRPLTLATRGWLLSVALGLLAALILRAIPAINAPLMIMLALCTTGLGILMPIIHDSGRSDSKFGRLLIAAGTLGEVGPIVAMALLMSQDYSLWQEFGFLLVFIVIIAAAIAIGIGVRPPRFMTFLGQQMKSSSQLPIRIALMIMVVFMAVSSAFGFESILGAFAAGLIVNMTLPSKGGEEERDKLDAVMFGWFYPFFFVGTGIKFDVPALIGSANAMMLVPGFLLLFLLIRGLPLVLYGNEITRQERLPFAMAAGVPSLSIIVVINETGLASNTMTPVIASAMTGASLLAVLLFPILAAVMLNKNRPAASNDSS